MATATADRPIATEQELASLKAALIAGEPQLALALVEGLIARCQFSSVLHYWHAAALWACDERGLAQDAMNRAQTYQSLEIIKENGGDLQRFQHDLDYARAIAERCMQARVFGPAMAGYGQRIIQSEVSPSDIIGHAHAVSALGRLEEARLGLAVVGDLFGLEPSLLDQIAISPYGVDAFQAVGQVISDWAEPYTNVLASGPGPQLPNPPRKGRRLRLGYLISDLSAPGLEQTILPVIAAHDAAAFEVKVYYDHGFSGQGIGRAQMCSIGALEDSEAFDRIRDDQIDLLIDVSGHLGGGRLAIMAAKAAPVQISWTAQGLSTGLSSVDFVVLADGAGQRTDAAETLWPIGPVQVPFVSQPASAKSDSMTDEQAGKQFGCLAHPCDLDSASLDLFAEVLRKTTATRLWLGHANYRDPVVQNIACTQFASRGIDPDRLAFPEPVVISASDVAPPAFNSQLDMILAPLGGLGLCHADTLQALSEGIPVLWLAHMNASVPNPLAALGLVEFMAMDEADFVQKAADWMASRARGDGHRQALKDQFAQSAYGDVNGFVGRMELAYRLMFDIWTSGHFQAEPMAQSRQWRVPDSHVLRRLA